MEATLKQRATEIEWLRYFYSEADLGPYDKHVRDMLKDRFEYRTGKDIPEGYEEEEV